MGLVIITNLLGSVLFGVYAFLCCAVIAIIGVVQLANYDKHHERRN